MRIGVDVMGGDNAPDEILKGALQALPRLADDDTLDGPQGVSQVLDIRKSPPLVRP